MGAAAYLEEKRYRKLLWGIGIIGNTPPLHGGVSSSSLLSSTTIPDSSVGRARRC